MDPKDMSDEELEAALATDDTNLNGDEPAGDPGKTPPAPDPADESRGPDGRFKAKPDEPTPEDTPPAEEEPQVHPDEEKPPSRREQLRIQQVLERVKNGNSRPQGQEPPRSQRSGAIDYASELDAEPEVIARLEEDRKVAENARYQEGLRQAQAYEWRTLLQVDAPQVERDHPQLDKNNSEFHPAVANSLSTMYLQMSQFDDQTGLASNPGMRWSDFVESIWELADEIGKLQSQKAVTEVARQAANTGLRPNGESTKLNLNKEPEQMSDAELDAFLAAKGMLPTKR